MPKEKKLLIATIILGAMCPVTTFGLGLITDAFLLVGLYCGISAIFSLCVLLDWKAGKQPNFILIGLFMAFFGFAFLGVAEIHRWLNMPLSALYGIAGLFVFLKGLKARQDRKQNRKPKEKKSMSKKIPIGIGMLVGGVAGGVALFAINPLLMGVGHIMTLSGVICLARGIASQKGKNVKIKMPVDNTPALEPIKTAACIRCGKQIAHTLLYKIAGENYCPDCKTIVERNVRNQHMICSVCGVDLPIDNMHVIDDMLICHDCFLKKYGNLNFYDGDENPETVKVSR